MLVSVRGANGVNLFNESSEPEQSGAGAAADLVSCRNLDLSVTFSIMPRLGLLRALTWPGLLYDEATGGIYAGLAGLTGPVTRIIANPSLFVDKPGVDV